MSDTKNSEKKEVVVSENKETKPEKDDNKKGASNSKFPKNMGDMTKKVPVGPGNFWNNVL